MSCWSISARRDTSVYNSSWVEHLRNLLSQRIIHAGLVINANKCHLAMLEVCYVGYVLGGGNNKCQVNKLEAVWSCQLPTTKNEVWYFCGLIGGNRGSYPVSPHELWCWLTWSAIKSQRSCLAEDCDRVFQDLMDSLCHSCGSQSLSCPQVVQTDASRLRHGTVLLQGVGEDQRPVGSLLWQSSCCHSLVTWKCIKHSYGSLVKQILHNSPCLLAPTVIFPFILYFVHVAVSLICDIISYCGSRGGGLGMGGVGVGGKWSWGR